MKPGKKCQAESGTLSGDWTGSPARLPVQSEAKETIVSD
jgi:hypothetical protein